MRYSESWLRKWVDPKLSREKLADALTMSGFEVEALHPAAEPFSGIIVGEITKVEKHPQSDRLTICEVSTGQNRPLKIVCGAPNVRAGMKAPVAIINAVLPDKTKITPAEIRGVASQGMLCSASELSLSDENEGLLELPQDAPLGEDLRKYFDLNDYTIDVAITPNRGDCLSIKGFAREVSAITRTALREPRIAAVKPVNKDVLPIKITMKNGCPHYVGRIIRNVKANLLTPLWITERLRRSGARSISPIVDVTNYVMLELGQPMHAFDLNVINKHIHVRQSTKGERIALLDGSEIELDAETMLITDSEKPLAIAGVMGGLDSGVAPQTRDIFLESAYFSPPVIARQRQFYNLNSDSAYRFERGVDPTMQREAIERATQLILEIAGGEPGPVIDAKVSQFLPKPAVITLTAEKITQVLGIAVPNKDVDAIFNALNYDFKRDKNKWRVKVPPYRFDLVLPEDLIEDIARLHGYDKIPVHNIKALLQVQTENGQSDFSMLRQTLADFGYHEVISYSFIDKKMQTLFDPNEKARELLNPITADMTVMRTSLWPGLANTLLYNESRQQHRVRLFEIGTCFITQGAKLLQTPKLAGLISGLARPEQWGTPSREADFYDLKGSLEDVLNLSFGIKGLVFKPAAHPALHPGQTAGIYYRQQKIGTLGALHPSVLQALDLHAKGYFIFEFDLAKLKNTVLPRYHEISKFPEIRRDIAILVNQTIPAKDIQDTIRTIAGDWLKDVFIFDVYKGKGISPDLKSVAVGLILQHPTRTLVDDEVTQLMGRVIDSLKKQLGAELRS